MSKIKMKIKELLDFYVPLISITEIATLNEY